MRHPIASRSCNNAAIKRAALRIADDPKMAKAIVASLVSTIIALVKSSLDDFKHQTPEEIKAQINTMPFPSKFKTETFANQVAQFAKDPSNLSAFSALVERTVASLMPGGKSRSDMEVQASLNKKAMDKQWLLEQAINKILMENADADLDKVSELVSELTGFSVVDCVQAVTLMQVDGNPVVQTPPLQNALSDARGSQTPDMGMGDPMAMGDMGMGDPMGGPGMGEFGTPVADEMGDLGPDGFEVSDNPDEISIDEEVEDDTPDNSGGEVSVDDIPEEGDALEEEENPVAGLRLSSLTPTFTKAQVILALQKAASLQASKVAEFLDALANTPPATTTAAAPTMPREVAEHPYDTVEGSIGDAVDTANEWHGGQDSYLYSFASTGSLAEEEWRGGLENEIEHCINVVEQNPENYGEDAIYSLENLLLVAQTITAKDTISGITASQKVAEVVDVQSVEDTPDAAMDYIEANATQFENANVAEVQSALNKAGFSREVVDKAITDLLGPDATQALGTPMKVLLEN